MVKEKDDIIAVVPQVENFNLTVSMSSPKLEAQVKKEFNTKKSKIVPQYSLVAIKVGPKTSCEALCHDLYIVEQTIHNEYCLEEDV